MKQKDVLTASQNAYRVFCDGASSGNPGPGGWAYVFLGDIDSTGEIKVQECAGFVDRTTNNRMELMAFVEFFDFLISSLKTTLKKQKKGKAKEQDKDFSSVPSSSRRALTVFSDSRYAVVGATYWIQKWKRKNWKTEAGTEVLHQDLWVKIEEGIAALRGNYAFETIEFRHVDGHAGVVGNERADALAVESRIKRATPDRLYSGSLDKYPYDLKTSFPSRSAKEMLQKKEGEKQKSPIFYLSDIEGQIERHETWADCEKKVKGRSGARFKKISNPQEEEEFLKKRK